MENASKALLMSASVLIGVVIMSLAVYLYTDFSSSVNEMNSQMEQGQLQEFNNKFTSYEAKGKTLTVYDVVTVTNMAKENNSHYELTEQTDNNFYITVKFKNTVEMEKKTKATLTQKFINDPSELVEVTDGMTGTRKELKKYECKVYLNQNTGRVNKIEFF